MVKEDSLKLGRVSQTESSRPYDGFHFEDGRTTRDSIVSAPSKHDPPMDIIPYSVAIDDKEQLENFRWKI